MSQTAMLHVRMDEKLKADATAALEAMGLTAADAVRLLFHRIVADQAFPLELKVPNAETRAATEEARTMMRAGAARFASAEELFEALEEPAHR
jgi:DNA-damage-inducible protein J